MRTALNVGTSRREAIKRFGVAGLVAAAGVAVPARIVDAARPAPARTRPGTDLLFYSAREGLGLFYATDGAGGIRLLRSHTGWDAGWDHIVPGNFGGDRFTDLLFYDRGTGRSAFYATDGAGNIRLLRAHTGWDAGWDHIVPGNFAGT